MHSVYMNIIGIHAFKTSPTLVTMIDLRLNMFTLHVLIDIAFQFAGVTTVYTVPGSRQGLTASKSQLEASGGQCGRLD